MHFYHNHQREMIWGLFFKQYVFETLMEIVQYAKDQNEQVYFIVDANLRKYWIKRVTK